MAAQQNTAHIDRLAQTLALTEPVTSVKQVSATRAKALAKLGIYTVHDLLKNYPRRYVDMSSVQTIAASRVGDTCTIRGSVDTIKLKKPRRNLSLVEIGIVDETGVLIVTAFRQPWLTEQLSKGMHVAISGKIEFNYGFKRMTNPYIEPIEPGEDGEGLVLAIHPLTGSITAGIMRRMVENALERVRGQIDPLPLSLRMKYRLMSRGQALQCIHVPHTMDECDQARRRLAYEEVLLLQLALMSASEKRSEGKEVTAHIIDGPYGRAFEAAIPFELTDEQRQAVSEILDHMAQARAMNHMLLGDVGTGKTIVAARALACVADSGGQGALMAPTEILARQHALSLGPLFDEAGITWELLVGALDDEEKEAVVQRVAAGTVDVLIGTHAIIEERVQFNNLTLAVIDEQQRFGVEQRAALLAKGSCPDALYLTATPIPRTLALALYGNLNLSYLHGREGTYNHRETIIHLRDARGNAYDAALSALARGEQVYVVCPLISSKGKDKQEQEQKPDPDEEYYAIDIETDADMDRADTAAAEAHAAFLSDKVFVDYRVGLVHGKLGAQEKQAVMEQFRAGEIQVLVATTVIEVGVDVPNATVMIIEDADRFGLAQLHQLRGRVGRGEKPGEVHLISGSKSETALARLAALESTDDGFELASYDLSLRREGDILGNRQHGASSLKLVNVVRDKGLIEAAHEDARMLIMADPTLGGVELKALGREVRTLSKLVSEVQGG